jgi:beta-ketoacyl-acyl-carrier-protein synthase II
MEKIVVTGTGAICSVGHTTEEVWKNVLEGISGMGPITFFDAEDYLLKVACEVKNFDPANYFPQKKFRRRDRYQHFSAVAVEEALAQSGLEITEENAPRIGVVISTGVGGLGTMEDNFFRLVEIGPRKVNPFLIPMFMPNGAAGLVGIDHGPQGPAIAVASACASGQDSIGIAWMMLRSGVIDVAIAGASEAPITRLGMAGFDRLGAGSRRGLNEPTPSPFDLNRDGLVIGEGAAILILETESHAKNRGAEILVELAGYASTSDAHHITAPREDGLGACRAMKEALKVSGINPEQIDYINAHGTGTLLNDVAETKAIKSAFGKHAYELPISSSKSMTGHMMGATGALETVFCIQAVRENMIPPTINYHTPDPDCDLDYIPNEARQHEVAIAMSNAFGFGGHNAVLVVRQFS